MENSNNGLLGNPDELNWLNMINAGGIRGLLQSLSKTQITGGGNYGAGERVFHGNANIPLSDNFTASIGGNSVDVPNYKKNMITSFGGNYRTNKGTGYGLNFSREPNENGPNKRVMATLNIPF